MGIYRNFYMKPALLSRLAAFIGLLISFPTLASPIGENAGEIWVDGPADIQPGTNPANPDAAVDSIGRSIFVWSGNPEVNGGSDVYLRIFDVDRNSVVGPVQINTFTLNNQVYPRVAVSSDNSFLVVWQSKEVFPENMDVDRMIVRSQAFDANGDPVEDEQILSTSPTAEPGDVNADVAALPGGGYITVWRSRRSPDPDPDTISIQARRIGANGIPLADQFQVHTTTSAGENYPAVTQLADGGFLVAWTDPGREVNGRRFTSDGSPVGNAFQISTSAVGRKWETDTVMHEDGQVLVIWKDEEDSGDNNEIRGRLYSPSLVAQGSDFRINASITGDSLEPRAADYGQGGFFVVWESSTGSGDDEPNSIRGRIVTGRDQFASPQFLVNEWTEDSQQTPGIGGKNGRIAVAWDSQSNAEIARSVITGQFWYICGIFCDSFE